MTAEVSRPPALVRAAAIAERIDPQHVEPLRRRMRWTLFGVTALGSTGYIAAGTVGTIVAASIGGDAAFGGLPTAASVLGTAGASQLLSTAMLRIGRRPGLLSGLLIGVTGGAMALAAVVVESLPLLLVGTFLAGFANGAAQLARYVAADLTRLERRASAIGMVVWGSTIGAVVGPNLIGVSGDAAVAVGLPELAGAYSVTALFIGLAALLVALFLRPEPYALADPSALEARPHGSDAPPISILFGHSAVVVALASLIAGQVVMTLIMTMTPLHLTTHGHGLDTVGLVLSAHLFGMFALSPLSGRLTDRFGSPRIIGAGFLTLAAASLLAAIAPPESGLLLSVPLFLLGYGWNLGFVAASAMLTHGLQLAERTRVQGVADGVTWTSAGLASISSGLVVATSSYATLGLIGLGLLLIPTALLVSRRSDTVRELPA